MPRTSELPEEPSSPSSSWARYAGLGVQFAATVGVFVALGMWADSRWHTSPWLVLVGVCLGFTGALLALIRAVPPAQGKHGRSSASFPQSSKRPPPDS